MINELIKLANHLDQKGLTKEADFLDNIAKKLIKNANPFDELDSDLQDLEKDSLPAPKDKIDAASYAKKADTELASATDDFDKMEILGKYNIKEVKSLVSDSETKCKITFNGQNGLIELITSATEYTHLCGK
jgi:hypothetical protein